MHTPQIIDALKRRYRAPEYALFTEVPDATGFNGTRSADAVAMGIWPSRGLTLHGFEVKASRNDWLRELKNPAKAEQMAQFVDHWWVVVGDAAIVKDGELPPTWGLLVPRGDDLVVKVQAPLLRPLAETPLTRRFLAALLRRATEQSADVETLRKIREEARVEAQKRWQEKYETDIADDRRELANIRSKVLAFEQASGVSLERAWDWGKVGVAVQQVLYGAHAAEHERLKYLRRETEQVLARLDTAIANTAPKPAPAQDLAA